MSSDPQARTRSLRRDALLEAVADLLLRQFATDEDEAAFARLAVFPGPLMIALPHHVHALEDVAVVVIAEFGNPFRAQDLLALAGDQVLQPRHELGGIERLAGTERQRLHFLVVIVLEAAMAVIMIVVMMIMIMMMVIVAGIEEFRLDLEDA